MTTFATPIPSSYTDEAAWPAATLHDCEPPTARFCWQLGASPFEPRKVRGARCSSIVVETSGYEIQRCA